MTIRDVLTQAEGNIGVTPNIPTPVKSYNLNDLRENDEFNTVTERFLKSLGEGENADDLFEYFRGADFNLKDGFDVYRQSKQFTNQQKQDYLYLRNKFDNAEVGGLWEWVKTSADVGSEMLSDPTIIASALLVPWTGGTSAAARIAAGKATQLGLKKLASKEIAKGIAKGVAKLPGQKLKSPLTKVQTSAILGAEGLLYGGTYDYIGQQTQIETDQREKYDPSQTAKVAAITGTIGAAIPPIGRYAAKKIKKIPEFNRSLQERRLERIDNAENYKADAIDLITDKVNKALFFIQKPTSRFIVKAKRSPILSKIIKMFRYDAEQGLVAGKLGTQKRLDFSYSENLYELLGLRTDRLTEILKPLKSRGSVQVPSLGSRDSFFKIPFTKGKEKFKQSFFHRFRVDPELNDQLVYYLRSGETSRNGVKFNSKVITAGKKIRKLLNDIHTHAEKVGLKPGRVGNFFPRKWLISMLEADPKQFRKALIQKEGLSETEADSLIKRLLSPEEAEARSSVNIASSTASLKAPRKLTKLDDFELSKYLDNDVENVLSDYLHSTSSLIVRKEMFGETFEEFKKRYINKIQKELGQNRLTKGELKHLENLYLFTTGQKGFIHNKLGRAVSDTFTVMNQLSLLPLATITSFSEIGVPIVRGGKVDSKSVMSLRDSFVTVSKDWWNDIVKKDIDVRNVSLRELNALSRAMTIAREDRAMAIFGQAHGHRGTKLQNHFFKLNFLHHWTKFVQLTSYEVGKTKIYTNLSTLANPKGASKKTLKRLTDELNELGVDVDKGIKWINNGAKSSSAFYKNNVTKSAARYVDEVIMNPTQASALKPLMHHSPYTKWAFGLLGFPTAFSNTILRNAARDLTKDARNLSAHSSVNALTGASVMILSAVAGNTLRTGGKNFREVAKGEKNIVGSVKLRDKENTSILYDAVIRAGIFGPFEYGERIDDTNKFKNKILASITTLTGPATSDIISFIVQGRITETAFNNLPLATLLQKLHPEKYKEVQKYFREIDKETFGSDPYTAPAVPFSIGGEVVDQRQRNFKGSEISEDYPVTDVAKNPADRDLDNLPLSFNEVASNEPINPFTGEPYTALYYNGGAVRKQYNDGGSDRKKVSDMERLGFDKVEEEEVPTTETIETPTSTPLMTDKQVEDDSLRPDGTKKDPTGFLGPIENNVTGGIMSEVSMGIGPKDNQKLIPLLVPTLTEEEIEILQNMELEGNVANIPQSIKDKAIQHAQEREEQGLSPFYGSDDVLAPIETVITKDERYNNVKEDYGKEWWGGNITEDMFNHTGDKTLKEHGFGVGDKLDKRDNTSFPEIKVEFVNTIYNAAINLGYSHQYSLLMAGQAAKESAWGARAGGNAFGIKFSEAAKEAGYKPITITTHEVIDGVREKKEEIFVDLTGHSIKDNILYYNSLIEKRFPDVRKFSDQGKLKEAVQSLKHVSEGGNRTQTFTEADGSETPDQYATDPDYVESLLDTIDGARRRIGLK